MKKGILVVFAFMLICMSFAGCKKDDPNKPDDSYFAYISEEIEGDTVTLRGYNGGAYDLDIDIPVEKYDMSQYEVGTFIKIVVNKSDEILEIKQIDESGVSSKALNALKKDYELD